MKSTKAQVEQRVTEVLRLRVGGAEFSDIREYAAAQGWGVSDSQLWRYIAKSDEAMAQTLEKSREKLLARHLAQRRLLYAKSVEVGDYKGALACLRDEAELEGLYDSRPADRPGEGANGGRGHGATDFFEIVQRYAVELRRVTSAGSAGQYDSGIPAGAVPGERPGEPVAETPADPPASRLLELLRP